MKHTIIFLFLFSVLFFNCSNKKVAEKDNKYYYLFVSPKRESIDTLNYLENNKKEKGDRLIAEGAFFYNGKYHSISAYTSDNHAPTDGGIFYYILDSIGIIYSKSTTWPGYSRLQSNNDSINNLFSQAFGYILSNSSFHCYNCPPPIETIKFVPPVINEKEK